MIREFTLTARKNLMVLFKCASCQEINLQRIELMLNQKYEDKAFTQKGRDRQHDANHDKLVQRMDQISYDLESGASVLVFPKAKLKCQCNKCQARQPWSRMNYTWCFMLLGLVAVYIMGMLLSLMNNEASQSHLNNVRTTYLPLGVGAAALILLGVGIHFAVMAIKHRIATNDAPVIFSRNLSGLKRKAAAVESYRNVDYSEFE